MNRIVTIFCIVVISVSKISLAETSAQDGSNAADKKALAWYMERRPKAVEVQQISNIEDRFFAAQNSNSLIRLTLHSEKTVSLPAAWRTVLNEINASRSTPELELSWFLGFLEAKCGVGSDRSYRNVLLDSVRHNKRRGIYLEKSSLRSVGFHITKSNIDIEGNYPTLGGRSESEAGLIEKRTGDQIVWSKKIPAPVMSPSLRGNWDLNPELGAVLFSEKSTYVLAAFDLGIFLCEFEWTTGELKSMFYFEF